MTLLVLPSYRIILNHGHQLFQNRKGTAIPLQAWRGPGGALRAPQRLRLPDFQTFGT